MQKDIRYLKGVGEKRAQLFQRLGVFDTDSLLHFYPRNWEDLSVIYKILEAPPYRPACIRASVCSEVKEHYIRKNMTIFIFFVTDGETRMRVTLFNTKFLTQKLKMGEEYLFFGTVKGNLLNREMSAPEILPVTEAKIRPVYPSTAGLNGKMIASAVRQAMEYLPVEDPLPSYILEKYDLCSLRQALQNIHFPESQEALRKAKKRLIFQEFLTLQLGLMSHKTDLGSTSAVRLQKDYTTQYLSLLPYALTGAQQRVVEECTADLRSGKVMRRLIQGDVGSGKTVVCFASVYNMVRNGYQCALMVPTEILAEQHYATACRLFEKQGISVELLCGSMTAKQKAAVKQRLADGQTQFVIGTHALLQKSVNFFNLGLVITDEQHRFGVAQRSALLSKGDSPHMLVVSATPIPRTLAMILYGDLELSVIDELPAGRQKIDTFAVDSSYRERVYTFIRRHLEQGMQAYIVCPLVEESDSDLVAATEYHKHLSKEQFADYNVGLLHGKLSAAKKEKVMRDFAENKVQILVATTVIEVGIDVPNATVMLIEDADRFGLSQLHQLRGRIGRGSEKSTCILITDSQNAITANRLRILCATNNGFYVAEEDLKLRGPGDFLGKRQHGLPALKIADLTRDLETLRLTGKLAKEILNTDPALNQPQHRPLYTYKLRLCGAVCKWRKIQDLQSQGQREPFQQCCCA